jgi:WS/DGAT/MGAT family acyltransferase
MWLEMDRPNNLMVITSVVFLESQPAWDRLLQLVRHRVVARYPVFRQRPVPPRTPLGRPSWADDTDFDLARHVHRVRLPAPGPTGALQTYIGDLASRPLDPNHPLWEMHVVEGPDAGAALVCRTHHSMADGLALARVLLSLTDDQPGRPGVEDSHAGEVHRAETGPERTAPTALAVPGVGTTVRLGRLVWRATRALARPSDTAEAARLAWRTAQVAGTLLLSTNPPSPLAGEPGAAKLVVWSRRPLPLSGLKGVRNLSGATVNDVLMSAVAAALHRYQREHGAEPVDLITMVPVNRRPPGQPLPPTLGNQFALVLLTLPSAVSEPLVRLAETKRRMDWVKDSPEAAVTSVITEVIGRVGGTFARPLVDFFANKTIGVTTNVRGPGSVRYLAGTAVTGVLGWVPGSGRQTLGICLFTYADTVQAGFMSDASLIPDLDRLLAAFEDELDLLVRLGPSGRRAGPGDGRRTPRSRAR